MQRAAQFCGRSVLLLAALVYISRVSQSLHSAEYALTASRVHGGGGTSAAGPYSITGAVSSYAHTPVLIGGNYTLSPGLWAVQLIADGSEAPPITISHSANAQVGQVVLSWPADARGWILQQSVSIDSEWVDSDETITVSGNEQSVLLAPSTPHRFYRLIKP